MKAKIILIGGISRCGKSSLAQNLAKELSQAVHLDQDDFMLPEDQLPTIRDRIDWEKPQCLDWEKLLTRIKSESHHHEFIIVEGIFAFCNTSLVSQANFKVNLLFDKESFLASRTHETRWGHEPEWYIEHVWQSHLKYHNPFLVSIDLETTYTTHLAKQIAQTLL